MLYGFSNAIVFLFLFNLIMNTFGGQGVFSNFLWLGTSVSGWGILLFLGVGPTLGGFGLYLVSLNYLPATVAKSRWRARTGLHRCMGLLPSS